ncbi:chloride channel protein [Nocardia sp. CDC160]|uniref:chloride channel protein n=1 Tax=Nocardia sp. CDC160 TaxID=3112166 RepID=UPI002DB56013|nr:chloride channel protein [Nocardia sp. CDC160]MEC3916429.1 chloride channel protein [Nocardia sp. CDC160]
MPPKPGSGRRRPRDAGFTARMGGARRPVRSERLRTPAPVFKRRMPSKRGAMEQPNARQDGEGPLTPVFWLVLGLTGVAAGLSGVVLMSLLFHVEAVAFPGSGSYLANVADASGIRRVNSLLIAGMLGGIAIYLLRRYTPGEKTDLDDIVWTASGELSFRRCLGTAVISEVVIGLGASLGREAASKLMGGAFGSVLGGRFGLTAEQRRLLIACGGGAGLACVYNVPLGGAFFTAEILLGTTSLTTLLPALACSALATMTAWIYLPNRATYLDIPAYPFSASLLIWALLAGPFLGLAATGYIRVIGWLSHHRVPGAGALLAPIAAFGVLGLIGIRYPQLFGNGHGLAAPAFLGLGSAGLLLTLALLKPIVTALCLGSGVSGGLFTPVLSSGAAFGAGTGILWTQFWPGSPVGAFAMVAAAAAIGSSMQAPLTGLALVLELTHGGFAILVAMIAATVAATVVVRRLDGYSIYSARLPARTRTTAPAEPPGLAS